MVRTFQSGGIGIWSAILIFLCLSPGFAQMDWAKHTVWTGLNEPERVYPVDIDFDGDIDFLGALRGPDSIVLFLNDGNMDWSMEYVSQSVNGGYDVIAVDLDFDGDYDIVANAVDGNYMTWFENDGQFNWTEHRILENRDDPHCLDLLDYDHDGDLDILTVISNEDCILILENDGAQTFSIVTTLVLPGNENVWFAYWHDLDHDADYDIITSSPDADLFLYYENQGNSTYAYTILADNYDLSCSVDAGDFDKDGDVDITGIYAYSGGGVVLWDNQGNGTFVESQILEGVSCDNVTTADLDHDGNLDIIPYAYTYQPVDLSWLENTQPGWSHHVLECSWALIRDIDPVDLDRDGDLDLLVAEELGDRFTWLENRIAHATQPPFFGQTVISDNENQPAGVSWTDFDLDGDYDLLSADVDGLTWWEQTALVFTEQAITPVLANAMDVLAEDLDHDGDVDLVAASSDGEVVWYERQGAMSFQANVIDPAHPGPMRCLIEDFNRDGSCDIAVAGLNGVRVYMNDGSMQFSESDLSAGVVFSAALVATDLDRDGDADLVSVDEDKLLWYENHRDGTFTQHVIVTEAAGFAAIAVCDLDLDGDGDLISGGTDGISWWANDGLTFTEHMLDSGFLNVTSVSITDILWDGWPDVVASGSMGVKGWINEGGGVFSAHPIETGAGGWDAVIPVDLDRNGVPDLAGVSSSLDRLAYWSAEGALTISIEPMAEPVIIPPWGGSFDFRARLVNRSGSPMYVAAWTEATLPNGSVVGPLILYSYIGIGPYSGGMGVFTQSIPGFAPMGDYTYTAKIGGFPSEVLAADMLSFSKAESFPGDGQPVTDWSLTRKEDTASGDSELPREFALSAATPNPFNSGTQMTISLPENATLEVAVYNITGQLAATIAAGDYPAGRHVLTFSGTGLASGVYFVRATVPGQLNDVQKLVLMK